MPVTRTAMSVMGAIHLRRSVRSYLPAPVERDSIHGLLTAAVRAPTAMHGEPWGFVVIQDRNELKRISDRAKTLLTADGGHGAAPLPKSALDRFTSPEFNVFYDASTLIIICGRGPGPMVSADCWLAAENLMLAACSMGLGSCVIGLAIEALQEQLAKDRLAIPADMSPIVPIIVGTPRGDTPISDRKDPHIISWRS
jgi:nitroreductase